MLLDLGNIKLQVQHHSPDLAVVHLTLLENANSGLHRHGCERETFFILTGEIGFVLGQDGCMARVGEVVSIPQGLVHRFFNPHPEPATAVLVLNPGGLVDYFVELQKLLTHQGSRNQLEALNQFYGLEFF
jgi:mannose-6-phosphate isomerase-like protein (cupin superfamily)